MRKSEAMPVGSTQKKPWGSANPSPTSHSQHIVAAPTTFVQADTNSFRELVQKLTGASDDTEEKKKLPITVPVRYVSRINGGDGNSAKPNSEDGGLLSNKSGVEVGPRKPVFKLHERRQCERKLEIKLALTSLIHDPNRLYFTTGGIQSPALPALVPSPVTPLGCDPFTSALCNGSAPYSPPTPCNVSSSSTVVEEQQAMAQKGFYLHPSPSPRPRNSEPELLPLFPLHSPRGPSS